MPLSLMNPLGFTTLKFSSDRNTLNSLPEAKVEHSCEPSTYSTASASTFLPVLSATLFPLCDADVELMSIEMLKELLDLAESPSLSTPVLTLNSDESEKTDVLTERKRKPAERESLLLEPNASKVSRSGKKTDIAIERNRHAALSKKEAIQAKSLCAESAIAPTEQIEPTMKFDAQIVAKLLGQNPANKKRFTTLFEAAVKQGYKGAKTLDGYLLAILKQCNATYKTEASTVDKAKSFKEINKAGRILSFELMHPLAKQKTNTAGNEVWAQLDDKNCVVDLRRPSIRQDHRARLMREMRASANVKASRQLKIGELA